jgi:GGDEF domain-containing protein
MLADLAFETDPEGRFTAFGPGKVFGQPAANFLGLELAALLAGATAEDELLGMAQLRAITTTICRECMAWHGRISLAVAGTPARAYHLALAPRITSGEILGLYGILLALDVPGLNQAGNDSQDESELASRHMAMLDLETGLWSPRSFADELARRFDRLDVESLPGSLLYLGFSRAAPELWPAIALRLAEELREIVRPTDLLGRIDATTIALWCDGMDHFTAGERATKFCITLPPLLPQRTVISVGVGPRWASSGDQPEAVMEHAAIALRLADMACQRAGNDMAGAWRVWQTD